MLNKLKITVVIPTHNRIEPLKLAIESVINQTYTAEEIIVVDDVSNKDVENLVNSYKKQGVKYIRNDTAKGAAGSRNIGVSHAKNELIAFLDDDDTWFLDKLDKQVACFEDKSIGLVYSPMLLVFPDLNLEYKTFPYKNTIGLSDILIENKIGGTISVVVRKDWFLSVGGFDERYRAREEYDLWIRLIRSNKYKTKFCDVLSCRVINVITSENRISCNIDNYIHAIKLLNTKYQLEVNEYLNDKNRNNRASMQANFLASQAMKVGDKWSGTKYFIQAFKIKPTLGSFAKILASLIGWKYMILLRSKIK
jgi:glycosyltransferase involved in cell wall biosynthesis